MADELPIVQRADNVAVALYAHVNRFRGRTSRCSARELVGLLLRLLITLVPANRRRDRVP